MVSRKQAGQLHILLTLLCAVEKTFKPEQLFLYSL